MTGAADKIQLQESVGQDRNKFTRTFDRFSVSAPGLPPIFQPLGRPVIRSAKQGRPPAVYLLGETGAALLRANGFPDAHACELREDREFSHALTMLDIHLAATRLNLEIITDRIIRFGDGQLIRPDHQVLLPDGKHVILEVEQDATSETIRRISKTSQRQSGFFCQRREQRICSGGSYDC